MFGYNPNMNNGFPQPQQPFPMYQQPFQYGNNFIQPAPAAPQPFVMNQLLTPEQMQKLQKSPEAFNVKLTEDEYLRAICTHKKDNIITLEDIGSGRFRCSTCQAEFYLFDTATPIEEVEQICNNMYDLLQTIKTYYGNVPDSFRDFYLMIGFIKKIPTLWVAAKTYFEKITNQNMYNQQNETQNGFNIMSNILGPTNLWGSMGLGGNPGYYNNFGPPPMAQPQMPQQPWGQPAMPAMPPTPQMQWAQQQMMGAPQPQTPMAPQAPMMGQTPQYGFNNPVMPSQNPIGYVDPTAMTPPMPQPPPAPTQPQPVAPAAPAAPPANPNVVAPAAPEPAAVGKKFK